MLLYYFEDSVAQAQNLQRNYSIFTSEAFFTYNLVDFVELSFDFAV